MVQCPDYMKKRILSALIILGLTVVLGTQFKLVAAYASSSTNAPLTAPVTFYKIMGRVKTLKLIKLIEPTPIFTVQAVNLQTGITYTDQTDASGDYEIQADNGKYKVSVLPFPGFRFLPKSLRVWVTNHDIFKANFIAIWHR